MALLWKCWESGKGSEGHGRCDREGTRTPGRRSDEVVSSWSLECSGNVGVLPGCNRAQDRTKLLSFSINQNHTYREIGKLPSASNSDLAGMKGG